MSTFIVIPIGINTKIERRQRGWCRACSDIHSGIESAKKCALHHLRLTRNEYNKTIKLITSLKDKDFVKGYEQCH